MFILLGGDVIFAIHQLDCFHLSETPQADYSRLRFQTGGEKGDAEEAGGSAGSAAGGGAASDFGGGGLGLCNGARCTAVNRHFPPLSRQHTHFLPPRHPNIDARFFSGGLAMALLFPTWRQDEAGLLSRDPLDLALFFLMELTPKIFVCKLNSM